jgi:anaerobic selenocysteine-containing dehydrogenase
VEALKRGARLIVVDPRQTGPARKADIWLRVRPGTDGALALGIAQVMIERGWYDRQFIRDWTNGPLLVREDNRRFLKKGDITDQDETEAYVAWSENNHRPIFYDPASGSYEGDRPVPALTGSFAVKTIQG